MHRHPEPYLCKAIRRSVNPESSPDADADGTTLREATKAQRALAQGQFGAACSPTACSLSL